MLQKCVWQLRRVFVCLSVCNEVKQIDKLWTDFRGIWRNFSKFAYTRDNEH